MWTWVVAFYRFVTEGKEAESQVTSLMDWLEHLKKDMVGMIFQTCVCDMYDYNHFIHIFELMQHYHKFSNRTRSCNRRRHVPHIWLFPRR